MPSQTGAGRVTAAVWYGAVLTFFSGLAAGLVWRAVAALIDASDSTRLWAVTVVFFAWTLVLYDGGE